MSRLIKTAWNKAFMSLCFLFPILNCKHANNILSKKIKSLENREMNAFFGVNRPGFRSKPAGLSE